MESHSEAGGSDVTNWSARYQAGDTPWDHGQAHPELSYWLARHTFPGEVFVPGCGRGYDAHEIAKTGVSVLGLDIAPEAIATAQQMGSSSADFQVGDIFALPSQWKARFFGAFEHTCYCAIPPTKRPDYVRSLVFALRPNATFLACFYLNPDTDQGPPFSTGRKELDQLFSPYFSLEQEWVPFHTFPGREGRELFRVYRRKPYSKNPLK